MSTGRSWFCVRFDLPSHSWARGIIIIFIPAAIRALMRVGRWVNFSVWSGDTSSTLTFCAFIVSTMLSSSSYTRSPRM